MMDVVKYVNSQDIAAYLSEIRYKFNTLEASWLIYQSRKTPLCDKIHAWQDIIATMPDCKVERRINCISMESWHDFLKEYIRFQERLIEILQRKESGCVYRFELRQKEDYCFSEYHGIYSTYEKCLSAVKQEVDEDFVGYNIWKMRIDEKEPLLVACYGEDQSLMSVMSYDLKDREQDLQNRSFDGLWFDFPTPFEKGDIIFDPENSDSKRFCGGPFVVTDINMEGLDKNSSRYKSIVQNGDSSDMNARGYFQHLDGTTYYEVMSNYMDCEYFRGDLTGKWRILKAMSNFLKGNIDEGLLVCAYHQILMEEFAKDNMPICYTDEGLELAGLKS